jgi:ClpX C4-type zinc finger protein
MVFFEIRVNGERRFAGDDVKAITVVSDPVRRREVDRVTVHVGCGGSGGREVQYFGSDLQAGDEISIRLVSDEAAAHLAPPDGCSFCGSAIAQLASLVAGGQVAICGSCILAFDAVVTRSAALPVGASIREDAERHCGFCLKAPPEVAAVLVRNAAAICPECLRVCVDITSGTQEP